MRRQNRRRRNIAGVPNWALIAGGAILAWNLASTEMKVMAAIGAAGAAYFLFKKRKGALVTT